MRRAAAELHAQTFYQEGEAALLTAVNWVNLVGDLWGHATRRTHPPQLCRNNDPMIFAEDGGFPAFCYNIGRGANAYAGKCSLASVSKKKWNINWALRLAG
jgi:hypothetical protein